MLAVPCHPLALSAIASVSLILALDSTEVTPTDGIEVLFLTPVQPLDSELSCSICLLEHGVYQDANGASDGTQMKATFYQDHLEAWTGALQIPHPEGSDLHHHPT